VDDQEIRRGGVSYSIDTVREYARNFPKAELWSIIGGDHVELLPKWRESVELSRLVRFAIVARPGRPAAELVEPFQGRALRGWPLSVSASEIRERIRTGLPITGLAPAAVEEAIRNNGLYLQA
jgi:nicotinate-nucleotide adenylyltransferase